MPITLKTYTFDGPFSSLEHIRDQSGVYAVLGKNSHNDARWAVLDIGEASDIRHRLMNHDRKACWKTKSALQTFAAFYCNGVDRMRIEKELLLHFGNGNLCGDR